LQPEGSTTAAEGRIVMKTLSIVGITAFAFLATANFASAQSSAQRLQVSSESFTDGGQMQIDQIDDVTAMTTTPGVFANECAPGGATGGKKSPQLSWTNVPRGTNSFVVTAFDATAQVFHWGMYDIPGNTTSLPENAGVPESTFGKQVKNYSGALGYIGPCPPLDDPRGPHRYTFRVFALRQGTLDLPPNSDSAALNDAINAAMPLDTKSISGCWPSTPCSPSTPLPPG
jgi:Raf kinase inhibitor-like YbhB/YbcL family protein